MSGGSMSSSGAREFAVKNRAAISTSIGTPFARPQRPGAAAVLRHPYGVILEKARLPCVRREEGSFSAGITNTDFQSRRALYAAILGAAANRSRSRPRICPHSLNAGPAVCASARRTESNGSASALAKPAFASAVETALNNSRASLVIRTSFEPFASAARNAGYRIAYCVVAARRSTTQVLHITSLPGLRMELPQLFEQTHRLVFNLIERGDVQGLRSLTSMGSSPAGLLRAITASSAAPLYVRSKRSWRATKFFALANAGSTGYDFINQVLSIFVDPGGET